MSADLLIAVAYAWIPITLLTIRKRRGDIPVDWTLLCFAAFIVLCGLTHVMGIITVWNPIYWLDAQLKLLTGLVSIATAILLRYRVLPLLLSPIVGTLDSQRAEQLTSDLLAAVERHRARIVILDLAGVAIVDTAVADVIVRTGKAVRLLGASAYVTGMRGAVAQTVVQLGIDLTGIETFGALQDGLAKAMGMKTAQT